MKTATLAKQIANRADVGVDVAPLQTNTSGLRVCQSELGYEQAFSFEDGSTIHSNMDSEVLGEKIILKPGQNVRYVHSWDPRTEKLPAPNISLPDGNSVKIKVLSAKNLDGTDGQTVFTHDGISEYFNAGANWQDFGIVNNGNIENASDIEIEVGSENPVPVVEQTIEQGAESTAAELTQAAEVPVQVEIPAQTEPLAQAELPIVAEQPTQAELVVEKGMDTAEKVTEPAGVEFVTAVEPTQAEPDQNAAEETVAIAEMPPVIVVEKPNVAEEASIAEQPVVTEPMPDIFVGQPDADTAEQSVDTNANDGSDVLQNLDTAQDADTQVGTDAVVTVEYAMSETDVVQKSDTFLQQDSSKDTAENKNENGSAGGCSCSISADSKSNSLPYQAVNVDILPMAVGAVALIRAVRWALRKNADRFMA